MIKNCLHLLARRIDSDDPEAICIDPMGRMGRVQPQIYVPHCEPAIYRKIASEKPVQP